MAKGTNNDLQNTTQKTKDRATGTPLQTGSELSFFIDSNYGELKSQRTRNIKWHYA
jgi:hypothetical protein